MEHYKARGIYGNMIFAWRSPGSNQINYRMRFEDGEWGSVETHPIPAKEQHLSVPDLMYLDWHLDAVPVRAS